MELQQHTNLKSVNIQQFIQCNKNAVYMRKKINKKATSFTEESSSNYY